MIYSPLIQKAIAFAIPVHANQKRKGKDTPYIAHVLSVGLILSRVTNDEAIIAAGVLHDTIEDCQPQGSVTKEILTEQFGERVARIVDEVTEQNKALPWKERKRLALERLKQLSRDSLLVKGADVLHNLSELVEDIEHEGEAVFTRFNAPKADQIGRYRKLLDSLKKRWPEHPLLPDLEYQFGRLLELTK